MVTYAWTSGASVHKWSVGEKQVVYSLPCRAGNFLLKAFFPWHTTWGDSIQHGGILCIELSTYSRHISLVSLFEGILEHYVLQECYLYDTLVRTLLNLFYQCSVNMGICRNVQFLNHFFHFVTSSNLFTTVNPLKTDTRYKNKIRYDNLNVMKPWLKR